MRIAIYHNLSSGGAKRSLHEFTKRLVVNHQVDVYSLSCGEHEFADLRPLVKNHYVAQFNPARLLKKPFGRINQLLYLSDLFRLDRLDKYLAAQIDRANYDVVFVHHCRYRQSPGVLRFLRTPTVYYCQEPPRKFYDPPIPRPYERPTTENKLIDRLDPLPGFYSYNLRRFDKLNVPECTKILVNSHHSHENVWRVYGKRPEVCYLGVDSDKFKPISCPKENILLSVGTINPIKGHNLLIEGLSRLPKGSRPSLVIISNFADPREKRFLEKLAEDLEVSLVIKPIINDITELATWYSRAPVTGYTPILEPLGLVALESMACETPVVGVREGGLRETILDGVSGILVERDPDDLGEALNRLFSNADLRTQMGRQGRVWVNEKWSWDNSVAIITKALEKASLSSN